MKTVAQLLKHDFNKGPLYLYDSNGKLIYMSIQMDIGLNVNIMTMVTVSILRIQMDIGLNKNSIPMVT
jgi:hypothetical protein